MLPPPGSLPRQGSSPARNEKPRRVWADAAGLGERRKRAMVRSSANGNGPPPGRPEAPRANAHDDDPAARIDAYARLARAGGSGHFGAARSAPLRAAVLHWAERGRLRVLLVAPGLLHFERREVRR